MKMNFMLRFALISACVLFLSRSVLTEDAVPVQVDDGEPDINEDEIPVVTGHGGDLKIVEEADVLALTADNFDLVAGSRDLLLVEFYAPWCGHCKRLEPEYAKAATELKKHDPPIEIAKVDATKAEALAQRYEVKGFPTILLLKRGEVIETYEDDRSSQGFIQFMKKRADPNYKPPPKRVIELTDETFDSTIQNSAIILVQFYGEKCTVCKQLAPKLENAAIELYEHGIPVAKVDADKLKDIAEKYDAKEFPDFRIFRSGRSFKYEGPQDAAGMVPYMIDQERLPSLEVKNAQQLNNKLSNDTVSLVGFFKSQSSPLYTEFIAAAYSLKRLYRISHSFDENIAKHYSEKLDSVVIFKPVIFQSEFEPPKYRLSDVNSKETDIKDFVEEHKVTLVGQRTKNNIELYSKRPLCVIYCDVNFNHEYRTASQIIRKKILKVAKEYKDITFALSNEEEFQDEMQELGLSDSSEEINVALFHTSKKYVLEPEDEFDVDVLTSFLDDVISEKIKPKLKSQPIPKKNSGPVKKIVANNFEDLVMKSSASVFLEFYAPWCGHCKALDPILKKLGKHYSDNKRIIIGQFDATANDVDERFSVTGFPTLFFLSAKDKSKPIPYEGERTLEALISFLDVKLNVKAEL